MLVISNLVGCVA